MNPCMCITTHVPHSSNASMLPKIRSTIYNDVLTTIDNIPPPPFVDMMTHHELMLNPWWGCPVGKYQQQHMES
jgi:hypothetical protein